MSNVLTTSWSTLASSGGTLSSATCTCLNYYGYCIGHNHYTTSAQTNADIEIRKVSNGFVVKINHHEYVFEHIDSMNKFIKGQFKKDK